jgi:23S rRNA (guanosine2251-2'-O)-methyltransferase
VTRSRGGDLGGSIVPGPRATLELLRAKRRRVHSVTIARDRDDDAIDEIVALAAATGASVRRVDPERLRGEANVDAPQGVLARADAVLPAPLAPLLADDAAFLVALDGVTDPHNLGAVLRSAVAAGVTGVVVPRRRSVLLTPAAVKAAAGAVEHARIALVGGVAATLDHASRAGVWTVGLDAAAGSTVDEVTVADRPLVLVVGGEGTGLARLVRERCDVVARIPMPGPVESLNVSVAAAIACFEIARHRAGNLHDAPG